MKPRRTKRVAIKVTRKKYGASTFPPVANAGNSGGGGQGGGGGACGGGSNGGGNCHR